MSKEFEETEEAIKKTIKRFKEETGVDCLEDGDAIVGVLNNCAVVITFEHGKLKTEFVPDTYKIDMSLSIYEEAE